MLWRVSFRRHSTIVHETMFAANGFPVGIFHGQGVPPRFCRLSPYFTRQHARQRMGEAETELNAAAAAATTEAASAAAPTPSASAKLFLVPLLARASAHSQNSESFRSHLAERIIVNTSDPATVKRTLDCEVVDVR